MFRGSPGGVPDSWLSRTDCGGRSTGPVSVVEGGVEEFNVLGHAVFRNGKIFGFEISDELSLLVLYHYVYANQVRVDLYHFLLVRSLLRIFFSCA